LVLFLLINFDLNPAFCLSQNGKKGFFQFPTDILGNSTLRGFYMYFLFFNMKNNFINNNGATLLNISKNKKNNVESLIEELKNQEQEMITELSS